MKLALLPLPLLPSLRVKTKTLTLFPTACLQCRDDLGSSAASAPPSFSHWQSWSHNINTNQHCANTLPASEKYECPVLDHISPTAPGEPRIYSLTKSVVPECVLPIEHVFKSCDLLVLTLV